MNNKAHTNIKNVISIIIIALAVIMCASVYSKYNYNDFTKSVREKEKTVFSRDNKVKYSDMKSYKIENKDYNDAIFYVNVELKPYTAYKVTCMIKTENVENEENKYIGGAQIAIKDTTECSESVTGTTDWTEVTLMFNSKNRQSVDIAFRLGGYAEKSKGTAWFSNLKMEEGSIDVDNNWDVACFVIQNFDVNIDTNGTKTNINVKMTNSDIANVESNIRRLEDSIKSMSGNNVKMSCDIIKIAEPLKTVSYDEENGYYIDPGDVKGLIQEYIDKKEYDYIYIIAKMGNLNENRNELVHDWIGLGGMDYYGIGYSNIRLLDEENSYIYVYDSDINTFPEEVYIHEFLHTLEREEKESENKNVTELHDFEKFGYEREDLEGLRKWYIAYMRNTIVNADGTKAGLTDNAYNSKPIHESNFKYSYELNALKEPQNFIEELNSLINRMKKVFKNTNY